MKRFRFTLAPLLRLKKQALRLADLRLIEARLRADEVALRRQALRDGLDEAARGLAAPGGAGWQHAAAHRAWFDDVRRRLEAAAVDLLEAEQDVERAVAERQRVAAELDALETVRQRHWRDYVAEVRRHRQLELDELILRGLSGGGEPAAGGGEPAEPDERGRQLR
jgi:hypothetical protein